VEYQAVEYEDVWTNSKSIALRGLYL